MQLGGLTFFIPLSGIIRFEVDPAQWRIASFTRDV